MQHAMLGRKRRLSAGCEEEHLFHSKKCLLDTCQINRLHRPLFTTRCIHSCTHEAYLNAGTNFLPDPQSLYEHVWVRADILWSVDRVLEHLKLSKGNNDVVLDDQVNKRFLEFHRDMTEEWGAEDKQHSWAVIEKEEEVIMYGPFYPNYTGHHSEDYIIKQTQEILESEAASEDWKVYVFTTNSPCMARNAAPCMLSLVQKAHEWWSLYGVKTHIDYVKCWGFKGAKETLFRDVNSSQVNCINQTEDHEKYVKAAEEAALHPVSANLFSAVKHLLGSVSFSLLDIGQRHDWKSCFSRMHSILPEEKTIILAPEVNTMITSAQALLKLKSECLEECLEKGRVFAFNYTFNSQISEAVQDQIRIAFQQCWVQMIRDKHAEFVREKLTEDFNRSTVHLFVKDATTFAKQFLQIGRLQFSEDF
ncbi:uncharacterized protein V6R79_000474 [Siganus canaliculatus]